MEKYFKHLEDIQCINFTFLFNESSQAFTGIKTILLY